MHVHWQKPLLFILLLTPFLFLLKDILLGNLIDPIEEITDPTGQWSIRFLLLTLAITPLNKILPFPLIKYRRMVGVFCFFYVCLHFTIWLISQNFNLQFILEDVVERYYITIGFVAFLLLCLLAATSTNKMVRRLGRKWKKLHKSIYLITVLAITHFYLQAKSIKDLEPLIYTIIAVILLGLRVKWTKFKFNK